MRPGSDMSLFKVTLHIGLKRARKNSGIYLWQENTEKALWCLFIVFFLFIDLEV